MLENNLVIEQYQNGNLLTRFAIRNKSLKTLFASTRNVLNDAAFIQLMEDEEFDLKKVGEDKSFYMASPSMIVTLSKAICVKKGCSVLEVLDLKRNFVSEISYHRRYSDYYINFLDWIWRLIAEVDESMTMLSKRNAIYFTLMFMGGLSSEQASEADDKTAQEVFEGVYNDYISNEDTDYPVEDVIYCLLATAFLYYEQNDLTNYHYFIMKAKQINSEKSPMEIVVELLANEMLEV